MSKLDTTSAPISRRTIAKGAAWALPAVSIAAAAPSFAASPGQAGLTGFYAGTNYTFYNGSSATGTGCSPATEASTTPTSPTTNPGLYDYLTASVPTGTAVGSQVSVVFSLYSVTDTSNTGLDQRVTLIPGTYTMHVGFGVDYTATSTCLATNSLGVCTSLKVVWSVQGTGSTFSTVQYAPYRIGMLDGTTIPSGEQVSAGMVSTVFGGGPAPVTEAGLNTFNAGTYSGSTYQCSTSS